MIIIKPALTERPFEIPGGILLIIGHACVTSESFVETRNQPVQKVMHDCLPRRYPLTPTESVEYRIVLLSHTHVMYVLYLKKFNYYICASHRTYH